MKQDFTKFQNIATKVLALFGLVAILALGSFATISVARYIPTGLEGIATAAVSFSSIFVPAEKVVVTLSPSEVESGKTLELSWQHISKEGDGSYSINYPCISGVEMKVKDSAASQTIFCNTPFPYMGDADRVILTAISSKNRFVDVPLSIHFTRNGKMTPSVMGAMTLTITNTSIADSSAYLEEKSNANKTLSGELSLPKMDAPVAPSAPVAPAAKKATPQNKMYVLRGMPPTASTPEYGKADLKPTVIETGSVDKVTNAFTAKPALYRGDRAAVRFSVANLGTKSSGAWSFNIVVPTFPNETFHSETQASLAPGDRIEFTLGFDAIYEDGDRTLVVNADPTGSIQEASEENNIARAVFTLAPRN